MKPFFALLDVFHLSLVMILNEDLCSSYPLQGQARPHLIRTFIFLLRHLLFFFLLFIMMIILLHLCNDDEDGPFSVSLRDDPSLSLLDMLFSLQNLCPLFGFCEF